MSYARQSADAGFSWSAVLTQDGDRVNKNLPSSSWDDELVQDIKGRMILHWNYRNLTVLPQELLQEGEHVREIYLKRNNIVELSPDIGKLSNLTNLYLGANRLQSLPDAIGDLWKLEVLDVSQNELEILPGSIGKLSRLQNFVVTQNNLKLLPPEIKKLRNLKFLEASDNQLKILPEEIVGGLISLEEIGLDRNPLEFLPRNLCRLRKLRNVSACKCQLKHLPFQPFHSLVHGKSNPRFGSNYDDDGEGEDQSNFHFHFDGNVNLNYIPYWLLQLFGPHLSIFGCGKFPLQKINNPHDLPYVSFSTIRSHQGTPQKTTQIDTIYFDRIVRHIHRASKTCPSLLELSLRNIYKQSSYSASNYVQDHNKSDLPSHLNSILIGGPLSQCFECMQSIFTEAWPIIFSIKKQPIINHQNIDQGGNEALAAGSHEGLDYGCVLFCNFKCKQAFMTKDVTRSNLYFDDLNFIKQNKIPLE